MSDKKLNIELQTGFRGAPLAISVLALVQFGAVINYNDTEGLRGTVAALSATGQHYLFQLAAASNALAHSQAELESLPEEKANETYLQAVAAATFGFLQEFGGIFGMHANREDYVKNEGISAMERLHAKAATLAGGEAKTEEAKASDGVLDALRNMGAKVIEVTGNTPEERAASIDRLDGVDDKLKEIFKGVAAFDTTGKTPN